MFDLLFFSQSQTVYRRSTAASGSLKTWCLISTLFERALCSAVFVNQRLQSAVNSAFRSSVSSHLLAIPQFVVTRPSTSEMKLAEVSVGGLSKTPEK